MRIYVDAEYKCHTKNDGTMLEIDTLFFDGKCKEFIEGYKYDNRSGVVIYPFKPYAELAKAQNAYEHDQLCSVTAERNVLLADMADLIEEIYESDLERIEE